MAPPFMLLLLRRRPSAIPRRGWAFPLPLHFVNLFCSRRLFSGRLVFRKALLISSFSPPRGSLAVAAASAPTTRSPSSTRGYRIYFQRARFGSRPRLCAGRIEAAFSSASWGRRGRPKRAGLPLSRVLFLFLVWGVLVGPVGPLVAAGRQNPPPRAIYFGVRLLYILAFIILFLWRSFVIYSGVHYNFIVPELERLSVAQGQMGRRPKRSVKRDPRPGRCRGRILFLASLRLRPHFVILFRRRAPSFSPKQTTF